ncbi:MAG: formate dehydrogenase accessory sulfurtransferase FdhD [Hyphomicrobiales bacterium]|nr:formate dehydrogenase accessory sulfurtransferase FdhD [Hyphomicrobiales bacterium]
MDEQTSRPYEGQTFRYDGTRDAPRAHAIAVEKPINIIYGDTPYAVMMTSPADLEDFVFGFSLTEGVVGGATEIRAVEIAPQNDGIAASVVLTPDALRRHMARRRNLSGRTSCGLCGVESFDQIPSASARVAGRAPDAAAVRSAIGVLAGAQPLFAATRATHAAAWCSADGATLIVREDVGRHNALDKTIGACLRAALSPRDGFLLVTSRCSFEMVEKAAIFGAPALVSVSAPTSLAIDRAQTLGVALIAVAREDNAILYVDGAGD